jgi:hypothetical protein
LEALKQMNDRDYITCLMDTEKEKKAVNAIVTELVFDYFNIIAKEYEMTYDKWRTNEDFKE